LERLNVDHIYAFVEDAVAAFRSVAVPEQHLKPARQPEESS
jgi:hypothetical protein